MTEIILVLAGLLGGAVNTLAGGGSFILFPALLLAGVPPVMANASNTYACLPGYASGAQGLWRDVLKYRDRLPAYSAISILGALAGAELLLHVSDDAFAKAVPWLMAFAVVAFTFGGRFNRWLAARAGGRRYWRRAGGIALMVALFAVSLYGGFFNAGLGILLLAFLALAGMTDIHAMNGLKLYMSALGALVAVIRFTFSGSIAWYEGSLALVGALVGGYAAARLARHVPTALIRNAVIVYGLGLTVFFFYSTYSS